jgi:hypothetical protein
VQPLVRGPQLRLCVLIDIDSVALRCVVIYLTPVPVPFSLLPLPQPWGSATASTAALDGAAATGRSPATTSTPAAATTTAASTGKVNFPPAPLFRSVRFNPDLQNPADHSISIPPSMVVSELIKRT